MKRIQGLLLLLAVALLAGGAVVAGNGAGPFPPADCPDHDGDGICNGQDPDYVPGDACPDPECPNAGCPNPDCPDADGDGICNGQDPDYTRPGTGPDRIGKMLGKLGFQAMNLFGIGISVP